MPQSLDITGSNNLTCLVTQCTSVLYYKVHIRGTRLVSMRNDTWIIKCMTGFTHALLPLVKDYLLALAHNRIYSQVFTTRQILLASSQQELLVSNFNLSAIAHKQCTSHVTQAQHTSYLQIFLRHKALLAFFVNLDGSVQYSSKVMLYSLTLLLQVSRCTQLHKVCIETRTPSNTLE